MSCHIEGRVPWFKNKNVGGVGGTPPCPFCAEPVLFFYGDLTAVHRKIRRYNKSNLLIISDRCDIIFSKSGEGGDPVF